MGIKINKSKLGLLLIILMLTFTTGCSEEEKEQYIKDNSESVEESKQEVKEVAKIFTKEEKEAKEEKSLQEEKQIEEENRLEEEKRLKEEKEIEIAKKEISKNFEKAKVTKHVDGDTVHITLDSGEILKIRMIGVDTPETVHPQKTVEFFGKEASNFTKEKTLGQVVYLEKDVSDTDRYGRALRYIWMDIPNEINEESIRNKMFNGMLVAQGFANSASFPPDIKYQEYFTKFEREAKENNFGLWNGNDAEKFETANTPATVPNNDTSQNSSAVEVPPINSGDENTEVIITKTGKKYHLPGCPTLKSKIPMTLKNAKARGLGPCKVCNPPN